MTRPAETTSHVTSFLVRENDHGVYGFRIDLEGSVDAARSAGESAPPHATGGGKAISAHLDETRDDVVEAAGLPKDAARTITDRSALESDL